MTTYISTTVKDMKPNFFLKANDFKFTQKNLNSEIKEINVLIKFPQMFNMQALGY